MTKLNVPDMHCEHCVQRITKALQQQGMEFKVDLSSRTVEVAGDERTLAVAIDALDDLGFEASPA